MKNSGFGKLVKNDWIKGLIVSFLTALLTGVYQILTTSELSAETIKPVLIASIGAGIAYIVKNLSTNSDGKPLTSEPK